jgi:serine/threonine protein kinase
MPITRYGLRQGIAHRDVKPDNIFKTGGTYKVGDFGCFFTQRERSYANTSVGDMRYMSPQLREAWTNGASYNPFKADVFALGATALHLATLTSPSALITSSQLQEKVNREMARLSYSEQLRALLRKMLAYSEADRPSMLEIYSAICSLTHEECKSSTPSISNLVVSTYRELFKPVVYLEKNRVKIMDFERKTGSWTPLTSSIIVDACSRYIWVEGALFCSGGSAHIGNGLKAAHLLKEGEWSVTRLADMNICRRYHGLWWDSAQQSIVTFGGILYIGQSALDSTT